MGGGGGGGIEKNRHKYSSGRTFLNRHQCSGIGLLGGQNYRPKCLEKAPVTYLDMLYIKKVETCIFRRVLCAEKNKKSPPTSREKKKANDRYCARVVVIPPFWKTHVSVLPLTPT